MIRSKPFLGSYVNFIGWFERNFVPFWRNFICVDIYYKYYFFIEIDKFSISQEELINKINEVDVFSQVGSCSEVYKEKALDQFYPKTELNITKQLFDSAILLLCDPTISEESATENINKIKNILNKYIKWRRQLQYLGLEVIPK